MKSLVYLSLGLFFIASANAEIITEPNIKSLNLENGILKYSYTLIGGCEEHTPKVVVEIQDKKALIKILDSSPKEDICESFVFQSGEVNLKEAIELESKKTESEVEIEKVQLPELNWYSLKYQ